MKLVVIAGQLNLSVEASLRCISRASAWQHEAQSLGRLVMAREPAWRTLAVALTTLKQTASSSKRMCRAPLLQQLLNNTNCHGRCREQRPARISRISCECSTPV